ncbi:MAG: diacylglycerol kinase family protein [Verrucomicrobiota bacterium]
MSLPLKKFVVAWQGIADAFKTQLHFKIHCLIAIAVLTAAVLFDVEPWEWCVLILTIGWVLSAELLNTAIEHLGDAVTTEIHPLVGKAKDVAAGAVLCAGGFAIVIGIIIFLPYLLQIFRAE